MEHGRAIYRTWLMLSALLLITPVMSGDVPDVLMLRAADLNGHAMQPVHSVPGVFELTAGLGRQFVEVRRFKSADDRLTSSVKRYERITARLTGWPEDELMVLVKGRVRITDSSGTSTVYAPGEAILIPKGFSGEWEQLDTIEMLTVSYHGVQ